MKFATFAATASAAVYHEDKAINAAMQRVERHVQTLACTKSAEECQIEMQNALMGCATPMVAIMQEEECQSFMPLMTSAMTQSTELPASETLDLMCGSACLGKMKGAMMDMATCMQPVMDSQIEGTGVEMDLGALLGGYFDFMCLKNDATDEYCGAEMADFGAMQSQTATAAPADIDSACATMTSLGCCMTSLLEFAASAVALNPLADFPCKNLPPACLSFNQKAFYKSAAFQIVLSDGTLANTDFTSLPIITALRNDISAATGVPLEHISVKVTMSGSTATVTVTVRGDDDTKTKTYNLDNLTAAKLDALAAELGVASLTVQGDVTVTDGTISGAILVEDTPPAAGAAFAVAPAVAALFAVAL